VRTTGEGSVRGTKVFQGDEEGQGVIVVRALRMSLAGVFVGVVVGGVLAVGAVPALAGSAWWHLTVGSRPSVLKGGLAKDEVQELTVKANGGEFILEQNKVLVALVPFNATHEELQAALEGIYGAGDVEVSGGPGDISGSAPYKIVFTKGLADQSVAPIEVYKETFFGTIGLTCNGSPCPGNVSVSEVAKGRPDGQMVVTTANLGDANVNGKTVPVNIGAMLPAGLEAVSIEGVAGSPSSAAPGKYGPYGPVECSLASLSCTFPGVLPASEQVEVLVGVVVKAGAKNGEVDQASVSGGETRGVTVRHPIMVGVEPTRFGVEDYELTPEEEGGGLDTQAGSHPFQLTTTLTLNQTLESNRDRGLIPVAAALAKDLHFELPPGLIGNPTPFPQCTEQQFLAPGTIYGEFENACPPQTALGIARITINERSFVGFAEGAVPMFNLEPSVGEPARFGFSFLGVRVYLDTAVRTGGDYGVTVDVNNIVQTAAFLKSEVTFWGVPGDPRHDSQRGWGCLHETQQEESHPPCSPLEANKPPPFLALPTSCTGPLQTSMEADSWKEEGNFVSVGSTEPLPALDGCNRLQFEPSIGLAPDGQAGSTPTGLAVKVSVPQSVSLDAEGLAEADVKNTTVTLPAGVAINPAGADGLQACSEEQIGLKNAQPPSCPEASKIGLVKIKTPLLPNMLEGPVYLAAQNANPFGSLVAIYVFVEDPISGSRVKLAGEVVPDPVTGQLVSTFKNTPQLPFETFELHFFGGDRAPLSTPALCGAYTTTASIEPWTETGPVDSHSTFDVVSGPNGGPCADPLPFKPELTAYSTNIQAGAFTPFTNTMSREDGNQNLQGIVLHMPPGLSGLLTGVKLCEEAQANAGSCGPESLIGETIVSVGLGGDPFSVRGGRVYITGPYKGAPFGLSIVNPAKAGPYDLGQVVVRAKLAVDPITAAITVSTDDTGPYRIPTILDGIPLQIKHVNVDINRPGFTFNPTNCNPMAITGNLQSTEGVSQTVSVPFQVTNCATLGFKPGFKVSTAGKTSRANGASLSVKLTYPKAPFGSQANIKSVKVDLPKQLPSRLTTLQKACTAAQFEANPAGCPAASIVGHATAVTPLIPVPLTGPAYFVSYGGAKFPELVIALQGYGVSLDLHGETFISKAGITSSTFKTVPDAPVGSFELTLPQGKYSALAANGNLCKSTLKMPTAFTAQNGTVIKQSSPISVTGCSKSKKIKKARNAGGHHKKGKRN
jgi:hypothetical protein